MAPRTIFLWRLIGLYCIVVSMAMMARKQATITMIEAMIHDAPLMLFIGIVVATAGLAMVLAHNVWSGGAAVVIVTLVGRSALIKGVLLLFACGDTRRLLFAHASL